MTDYVPEAGEIVSLEFSPRAGHEQAGHRPAAVLSPAAHNRIGLMLCCPLTAKRKGYPFEVPIDDALGSAVLADQVKSLDWRAHRAKAKGRISDAELAAVRMKAKALIGYKPICCAAHYVSVRCACPDGESRRLIMSMVDNGHLEALAGGHEGVEEVVLV